jgi:predicted methyltransferase
MNTVQKTLTALLAAMALLSCSVVNTGDQNSVTDTQALNAAIDARSDADKVRDPYRHPAQTLAYFGIAPDMTVVEVLPGGGWYSRILAPYLADQGVLNGLNYADDMWPLFGFFDAKAIESRIQAMKSFGDSVSGWGGNGENSTGFAFGAIPESAHGSVDAVLVIRAFHHLNRFETKAGTRTQALADLFALLKPDGIVGVVQHRAAETAADDWAEGKAGYVKQSVVVNAFEAAGFQLVGSSDINANAKDQPTASDSVWRLPPSFRTSKEDPVLREKMQAIGESDRMTLLFRKPE